MESLENTEIFDSDLKNELHETFRRFDDAVSDYDFLLKSQETFLNEYCDNIKSEIIKQKNSLLIRVDHASKNMINKLETFIKECKRNLPNLKELNDLHKKHLDSIKSELADRRNDTESFRLLDDAKLSKIAQRVLKDLEKNIATTQLKMEKYVVSLMMGKKVFFEANNFDLDKDLFGEVFIKEKEPEIRSDLGHSIKVFCNATGTESNNHGYYDLCAELVGHDKLILGSNQGKIKLWNINTAECIKVLEGHVDAVYCLKALSNNRLASGSVDKTIRLWDLTTDTCVKILTGHLKRIFCLCFVEDDNVLISGAGDCTIKIWDLDELACTKTLQGHEGAITCLKLSDEKKLFSGSWDNSIKIWNLDSFECENSLYFDGFYTDHLDFFSNGNLISFHQSRKNVFIKIWNVEEGSCLKTIKMTNAVKIKLLTDHLLLVIYESTDKKNELESDQIYQYDIWNIEEQVSIKSFKGYKYDGSFYGLELLPNGNLVFCTDQIIKLINI